MKLLIIFFFLPLIYCTLTFTICLIIDIKSKRNIIFIPLKSLLYESILQYFVFLFLPIDLIRKWEENKTNSDKYVFLLPGYSETQFIFFRIRRTLKKLGVNFKTIKYQPLLGDLEVLSNSLKKEIDLVIKLNENAEIFIIGHSMGGLIGRHFKENCSNENIKQLLMIATPHNGTYMGIFGIGKCSRQLIPNSQFVKSLKNEAMPDTLNIYSEADSLICPRDNAKYFNSNFLLKNHPLHNSTLFDNYTLHLVKNIIANEQFDNHN